MHNYMPWRSGLRGALASRERSVDVGRANRNSLWLHPAHLLAVPDCRRLFQSLSHFPLLFLPPVSDRFFPFCHALTRPPYLASTAVVQGSLVPSAHIGRCFSFPPTRTCVSNQVDKRLQLPVSLVCFYGTLKKILYLRLLFVVFAIQFHVERLRSRSNGYRIELSIC
jgi:hypothetical protein